MAAFLKRSATKKGAESTEDSEHWVSVSDLMSGLMMVFLFISIALMRHAYQERNKIRDIAVAYEQTQGAIYQALMKEFQPDLDKWHARISRDNLSFEFVDVKVLFKTGSSELTPEFKHILNDFFPRYLSVLSRYKGSISEIRIEGHASTFWNKNTDPEAAYVKNMRLSQDRTRSVLIYTQTIPALKNAKDWMRKNIAAIGFSSSHAVKDAHGNEDAEASRRVTFRVLTNGDREIKKILESANAT